MIDSERICAFAKPNIKTVLAVPIFSTGSVMPSCVLSFYSMIIYDSVPFVQQFLLQALRILWSGLEKSDQHIDKDRKKDIVPAKLGEVAVNTEMQKIFLSEINLSVDISQFKKVIMCQRYF